jgi:hypothetical protein
VVVLKRKLLCECVILLECVLLTECVLLLECVFFLGSSVSWYWSANFASFTAYVFSCLPECVLTYRDPQCRGFEAQTPPLSLAWHAPRVCWGPHCRQQVFSLFLSLSLSLSEISLSDLSLRSLSLSLSLARALSLSDLSFSLSQMCVCVSLSLFEIERERARNYSVKCDAMGRIYYVK